MLRAQLVAVGGMLLALAVAAGPVSAQPSGWAAGPAARWTGYKNGGSDRVREVQRDLRRLHYRPGPVDGLFGPRTQRAVLRFQRDQGVRVDGIVGPSTLRRLRTETRTLPTARGVQDTRPAAPPPHPAATAPEPSPATSDQPPDVLVIVVAYVMCLLAVFAFAGRRIAIPRRRHPAAPASTGPAQPADQPLWHRSATAGPAAEHRVQAPAPVDRDPAMLAPSDAWSRASRTVDDLVVVYANEATRALDERSPDLARWRTALFLTTHGRPLDALLPNARRPPAHDACAEPSSPSGTP